MKILITTFLFLLISNTGFCLTPEQEKARKEAIIRGKRNSSILKHGRVEVPQAHLGIATFEKGGAKFLTTSGLAPCVGVILYSETPDNHSVAALAHVDSEVRENDHEFLKKIRDEAGNFVQKIISNYETYLKDNRYQSPNKTKVYIIRGANSPIELLNSIKNNFERNSHYEIDETEIPGKLPPKMDADVSIDMENGRVAFYEELRLRKPLAVVPDPKISKFKEIELR